MATIDVLALQGIDNKSNDLTRPYTKASNMINMEIDLQSTVKKRNGYTSELAAAYTDIIYYNTKDQILGFTNGLSTVDIIDRTTNTVINTLSLPSGIGSMSNISISSCENQQNLYFTNTDYNTYVMKYDGSNLYRAGLPTPRLNGTTVGVDIYPTWTASIATTFTRVYYSQKDINGNIVYSPYVEFSGSSINNSGTISVNSLENDPQCAENGFLAKYCYRAIAGVQTISSSNLVLNVTRHNYVDGEQFLMDTENLYIGISPIGKSFLVLTVDSVVPNKILLTDPQPSITFTLASVGAYTVTLAATTDYAIEYPVDTRTKLSISVSATTSATGYYTLFYVVDNGTLVNGIADTSINPYGEKCLYKPPSTSRFPTATPFENSYDSTTLKIMPPICKYIASFGYQMVYGSVQSFFTTYTNALTAPNQRESYANTSLIIYSDISTGDGPENVSELNRQKIGETWDGDITGLYRCADSLMIFKTRGVFAIDGVIAIGQYALRKIVTNFIGCLSHKSILESDAGLYFQGHNGIYYTNAVQVSRATSELDYFFTSRNYNLTRATNLKQKQKALFYIKYTDTDNVSIYNLGIVVIDYYYNEVYLWTFNSNPDNGFIADKLGNMYFCDGANLYLGNNLYNDNGSIISSLYSTTWHHANTPALLKKWLSLRTWGLTSDAFTATITTEGDWQVGTFLTTNASVYGATTQTDFKMLDMQTKRALRVNFSNSNLNENMVISGYELTYEEFNVVDKN